MSDGPSVPTPRRDFVQRITAGVAALTLGAAPSIAEAAATADEAWLNRIRGKHRQVFDCVSPNEGFGPVFALNWLDSMTSALNVPADDITAVVSFRHFALPLVLNDAAWAKYHIGDMLKVDDPTTKAVAARNVFRESLFAHPGMTYAKMAADRRVVMTACSMALTGLSGMAAQKLGVAPEEARKEWVAALIPGVVLVPSGVYAVHRAQQSGCSYCAAG